MQEQKLNSEQKDETQLPSSPNNSNTDVVRSPNVVPAENKTEETKDTIDESERFVVRRINLKPEKMVQLNFVGLNRKVGIYPGGLLDAIDRHFCVKSNIGKKYLEALKKKKKK